MSRRDDVNSLYEPSKVLDIIEKVLFVIDIVVALISLVQNQLVSSVAITIQVVAALFYFVCNTVDDGCFWYEAEKQRRKNSIQNGLGTRLSEYETEDYYNNNLSPSLEKYGINILESNFFSKEIAKKMLVKSACFSLIAVVALIVSCRYVYNCNVWLIIAQTAFSSYVLADFVMLVMYYIRMKNLYNEAYDWCVLNNQTNHKEAWLLSYIVEYEAIKAHYKIRLDENIFNKNNAALSREWETILRHREIEGTHT